MVVESVAPIKKQWTYTELAALDNEVRYEMYDGELIEMTAPKLKHQRLLRRLLKRMETIVENGDLGELYMPPHDLYISETTFFEPDLSFVRRERFADETIERGDDACLIAPPDLVIEVISPSTARNDRVKKFSAYAKFGVRHYWLFEPEEKTLIAYVLMNGLFTAEASLTEEDAFAPSLFPGVTINLAELFEP